MIPVTSCLVSMMIGQGTTPSVETPVAFLRSLKPGMTMAQVRTKLPNGTTVSKPRFIPPVDGQLTGTVFTLSGKIAGTVSFLRAAQVRAIKGSEDVLAQDYRASDPIHGVQITLDTSKTYSKPAGERLIAALTKSLGKPAKAASFESEWMNDFGGCSASWRLNGRAVEFYQFQGERYESRLLMILGESLFP